MSVRFDGKVETGRGKTGKEFVERCEEMVQKFFDEFKKPKEMIGYEEWMGEAENCCICGEELGEDRVRDHCHYTGVFRGMAHNQCNLKFNKPKFVPCFLHNLTGYDEKLFIRNLSKLVQGEDLKCICKNEENFVSFSMKKRNGNQQTRL